MTGYKYVVGIDFGVVSSGVSIAHVNDPFKIYTVSNWKESSKKNQHFHSSIFYKNDSNLTTVCGAAPSDVEIDTLAGDVYIPDIKHYLSDIDSANEQLGEKKEGLTIQKVVTDYLCGFIKLAFQRLQVQKEFSNSQFFEDFDGQDTANFRYCLVCPAREQEFMKMCFIETGLITKDEVEKKLSIITEVQAIAYYNLSLDRKITKIASNNSYLVCDIGETTIGIAKIHADTTESLSTVELISGDLGRGSIYLDVKFREYLEDNSSLNLNPESIEILAKDFQEKIKFSFGMEDPKQTALTSKDANGDEINITYADLNENVFSPVIDYIYESLGAIKEHKVSNVFLSGKHGVNAYFISCILDKSDNYLRNIKLIETTFDALSSGAVFSASRPSISQIPFSKTTTSDQVEPSSEEYIDKSYTNDGYNFIVGIDFGTTFSGCSYVNLKDEKKTIKTIRDRWPGGNSLVFGKAPTLLMFDKKMKPAYWGEEARLMVNHNKDLHLLGNFKLALDSDHSYGSDSNKPDDNEGLRNQGGKTKNENNKLSAMNVISSYLKLFKNHVVEFIITNEMNENVSFFNRATLLKKYKFKYIITVPAMWDTAARETMAEAAIAATLIKRTELDQLLLISEPGAAALYCEKRFPDEFKHESSSENDDESNGKSIENFIVCDAGGGTVDLVTYKLEVKDGVSQISQIGDAVGDTCGSTTLDKNFKDYLLRFYSDVGITINSSTNINFDGVMRDFDRKHKPYFLPNPNHGGHFNIDLPGQKETIHLSKDVNYRLTNDNTTLEMRNDDMKTKVFDPVVERVLELFKTQFDQAKKLNKKIDVILMVGGFSQSLYLQQRIKDNFRNECYIFVPEESTLAMSHGAVMYGLNPKTIIKEFAGRSFALEVQDRFEANDDVDKKVQGPDGQDYAKNRLQYFVKKGQGLKEHLRKKYTKEVYVEYPHDAVFAVYSSDTKDNTEGRYVTDKHTKIMETRVTLPPNVPGIQDRELILFKVTLETGHIEATVVIECQNALINDSVAHMSSNKKSSLKVEKKCNLNILKHKKHLIEYALVNSKVHK